MRLTAAATAGRIFLAIARGTLTRVNDAPKMQTADVRLLHDEAIAGAERFQDYGFTSVPKPADGSGTAEASRSLSPATARIRSSYGSTIADIARKVCSRVNRQQYDDQGQQI